METGPAVTELGPDGVRCKLAFSNKDLLLFRHLYVVGLDSTLKVGPLLIEHRFPTHIDERLLAECQYLTERGFLLNAPETLQGFRAFTKRRLECVGTQLDTPAIPERLGPYGRSCYEFMLALQAVGFDLPRMHSDPEKARRINELLELEGPLDAAVLAFGLAGRKLGGRLPDGAEFLYAYIWRKTGRPVVPLPTRFPDSSYLEPLLQLLPLPASVLEAEPSTGLIHLLSENLPVPGDEVPLSDIVDFVQDADTQRRLARLNFWFRREVRSTRELEDVRLDFEESLHDFTSHMKLADMRERASGIRVVLSVPLQIIEELGHLRPKGALDVLYWRQDRKATRLEAELSAPGGALAYIYEAERRFGAE